ncbi:hypothetical protein [Sporosarcina aquimarina]|uniref:Uncharacterized protein n=1 Tax=Sporosarcina aquimarina TaxID=114975 RepID=A0ABU4FXF9_9BACL|nr:hypothetical protein [Sporosarcina aquimarina]MDW0109408.1 hypothetical protein [Sporosarcina aquimarina]
MERRAATPGGSARAEDPGRSEAEKAAEAVPPGKRPIAAEINSFHVASIVKEKDCRQTPKLKSLSTV